jgi:beta-lactamase class C
MMKARLLLASYTVVCSAACLVAIAGGSRAATPRTLDARQVIARTVTAYAKSANMPGVAVAFYQNGKTIFYSYGVQDRKTRVQVTPDTLFELGSVTKTFAAEDLALAILDPSRNVGLNDPIVPYVNTLGQGDQVGKRFLHGGPCPASTATPLPPSEWGTVISQITLKELATHTSSLPDQPANIFGNGLLPVVDRPCYSSQDLLNFVYSFSPASSSPPPGKQYVYSDIGFGTLGYALQGIYQANWMTLTQANVLAPLGMTDTYDLKIPDAVKKHRYAHGYDASGKNPVFHWPPDPWPAGGVLRSTARDMAKYLQAALGVAGPANVRSAFAYAEVPRFQVSPVMRQGLAWATELEQTSPAPFTARVKDGGTSGFSSWVELVPKQRGIAAPFGIVVLVNENGVEGSDFEPSIVIGKSIVNALAGAQ